MNIFVSVGELLLKAKNLKLIPKKVFVTRDGRSFQTTVWVRPGQQENDIKGAQLDMFAEQDIDDEFIKDKLIAQVPAVASMQKDSTGKVKKILPVKEAAQIDIVINDANPENRNSMQAAMFGADLEKEPEKEPSYKFVPEKMPDDSTSYLKVEANKVYLQKQTGILDRPRPSWIPPFLDEEMAYDQYLPPFFRTGPNQWVIQRKERGGIYRDSISISQGKVTNYEVTTEVLVAMIDYYHKRAKEKVQIAYDTERNRMVTSAKEWLASNPDIVAKYDEVGEGRRNYYEVYRSRRVISGEIKPKKERVTMRMENRMSYAQSNFYRSNGIEKAKEWTTYHEDRSAISQKMSDMNMQLEDLQSTYKTGQETSYGNKGLNDSLLDTYGVKVKRQNGDVINQAEIVELQNAIEHVYTVFGDKSSMARSYGLKISHSGEKRMHALKAVGLFFPAYKAIGVSFISDVGRLKSGFILSHEWAHFMDNYVGEKNKFHFASDEYGSASNDIASSFKRVMKSQGDSAYYNRTCECFARAFEQYSAEIIGDKRYDKEDWYCDSEIFNTNIAPRISKWLAENDEALKSMKLDFSKGIFIPGKVEKSNTIFIKALPADPKNAEKTNAHRSAPKGYPKTKTEYADPNEFKYPIDTDEHVRAAISYFSKQENHGMYSEEQRRSIWDRIVTAAKKHGIEVSEKDKFGKSLFQDGIWLKAKEGLIAVKKQVNRSGKVFMQTKWVKPAENHSKNEYEVEDTFGNGNRMVYRKKDNPIFYVSSKKPISQDRIWSVGKKVIASNGIEIETSLSDKTFSSLEDAEKAVSSLEKERSKEIAKTKKEETYRMIPNIWKGEAKQIARKLIDEGLVESVGQSTQSNSKYLNLSTGKKIRMSDHDLPLHYEGADYNFKYGSDMNSFIEQIKKDSFASEETKKSLTFSGFPLQGRTKVHDMDISIENKKGSIRSGKSKDGHEWSTKMKHDYGYIRGTVGKDKDHLDCYIGPYPEAKTVFIVHQNNPSTGSYDEDKVMIGFGSPEEAKEAYLGQYDNPKFFGSMESMDIEDFKKKVFDKENHGKKITKAQGIFVRLGK